MKSNQRNTKYKILNTESGITLVALIITVVVLLILAMVSVRLVMNGGIIDRAEKGTQSYSEEEELEQIKLAVASAKLAGNGFLTTENLKTELNSQFNNNINVEKVPLGWIYNGYTIYDNGNIKYGEILVPKEYQQVEYIKSTGTQYINTKYICNQNTEIEIEYNLITNPGQYCSVIFNGQSGLVYSGIGIDCYQGNLQPQIGDFRVKIPSNDFTKKNIYISKDKIIVNNIITMREQPLTYNQPTTNKGMSIFASTWSNNDNKYYLSMNLYGLKIYTSEVIERNFIPCYTTTTVTDIDGISRPKDTIGLYDTVEGKFYVNKGTGTFLKGADV